MNENEYKRGLMLALMAVGADVQAHEDCFTNFTPDVSFALDGHDFWVEVKYLKSWPTSLDKIPHYTKGQEAWLVGRGAVGCGHCYLLVGTEDSGHAMWHWSALRRVRKMNMQDALGLAAVFVPDTPSLVREVKLRGSS